MSEEFIEKQLKLSKRQNKDERYDYLCSEFNAINYCIDLEKYTNKLQQENKKYKEVIDKLKKHCEIEINASSHYLENHSSQKEFIEYLEYQVKLQEELNDKHLATGFEEILSKYKEIINPSKKCPNPDGKEGICYQFDRFGDRAGCLGCELYTKEMFDKDDPLPGLTEKLKKIIGVSK